MSKLNVAVLYGGSSAEHEISIITALQAIAAMDTLQYHAIPVYVHPNGRWYSGEALLNKAFYKAMPGSLKEVEEVSLLPNPFNVGLTKLKGGGIIPVDVYFLAFHGQYGEDGCIQGLLELARVAYTGCNVTASALSMNKYMCKTVVQQSGIPVLPSILIAKEDAQRDLQSVRNAIRMTPGLKEFPLFVKPSQLGSSIGIGIAHDEAGLDAALAKAFIYDDHVLIEPCITDIMEINVSVLDGDPPRASVVEVPVATEKALTYEDKYMRGGSKDSSASEGMASLTRLIDPPHLSPEIEAQVQQYALKAFKLIGCSGVGRFDFIYDLSKKQLYFNELNAIPGSLSFYLWEKSSPKLLYPDIIDSLIQSARKRKANKLSLQQSIGFKAL